MGAAARRRACEIFHPEVVMSQIEALFLDLQELRQNAPAASSSSSPQLDLVRTFFSYATSAEAGSTSHQPAEKLPSLPLPVRAFRGPLWDLLEESLPRIFTKSWAEFSAIRAISRLERTLLIRTSLPLTSKLRHWVITSRWQRWLFPACCAVPYLVILLWLLSRGLVWVAQVLLAPLVMGGVLAGMTLWLAKQEFRNSLRR